MRKKQGIIIVFAATVLLAYALCLPRELFSTPVSAVLEGSDGTLLGARVASDGQWRFPPCGAVPQKFADCIITYEDKRFRRHIGVDFIAIARAACSNVSGKHRRSGASTITMQVIRLSRPGAPRNYAEKLYETILATRLELRCSKDDILGLYADNAPFGGNVVGIQAAAWRYWGRSADDLSWAESATLAVLPNSPSLIHPGKSRDRLLKKRNFLLDKLLDNGTIDSLEHRLALEESLPDRPLALPDHAHHYLETQRKRHGDRRFSTGLDPMRQTRAEELLERYREQYSANQVHNIAALVLEVSSGEPLIYCGNAGNRHENGCDVDVVIARRSSGSTLKPFLYAAMLDSGQILPTMLIADTPFHYKDFSPSNFSHSFDGAVTAESVIRRSLNVPSVRMLHEFGTGRFIQILQECGFTTIDRGEDVYGLSLILGGAEISLADLALAYRNMAFKLARNESGCTCPLSRGAVWCTFEALRGVTRPEEEVPLEIFSSARDIAWKTGTSYGNRDAWSVGVTPDYVIAVWVGNCSGEGRPALTGVGYAAPVMFDLLGLMPSCGWFERPDKDIMGMEVCSDSGYPVSDICPADHRATVYVPKRADCDGQDAGNGGFRISVCPYHKILHLSPDGAWQVDSGCCDPSQIRNEAWFVLPPAQQWYYKRTHSDYPDPPPYHPQYRGEGGSSAVQIIYPQYGMKIATPLALDGVSRGVVFSAAHNDPGATLYWHLDSDYLGQTSGTHKLSTVPRPGRHLLLVTDTNGNSASVMFDSE